MISNALDGAISRYDTLNNFPRVLQQIGFSAEDSEKAINRLSDGIQGLPTTLDDVASTAQRIAIMTGDLDGAVETTLALNNAFISSGSNAADASRGLEQYVQMMSTGTVDVTASSSEDRLVRAIDRLDQRLNGLKIQLDTGALVGETFNEYDRFGGNQVSLRERWY
jgi:tape measure domain-containing protein